jgi:ABC-2 type transport system ATP-binding protein
LPSDAAIDVVDLACRYGRTEAVRDVTFVVRPGSIFALLGPNGAGKTTTIRVLMNMLRPARGLSRVLGVPSERLGPRELAQIGYVSENQQLPHWMTVADLLSYCRPFYPTWDPAFADRLAREFQLPVTRRIGHLSRGMRAKAALVTALSFRPRLLVLDEPFSGLDPVVREDLVHGVLQLAGEQQWTVLLSSHDLDEVERLVDEVGFLDDGHLVLTEPFAHLQARFRAIDATVDEEGREDRESADGARLPSTWIGMARSGRVVRFVETRYVPDDTERQATEALRATRLEVRPMSLREIFVALVRHERARTGRVPV